jgi:hypothetical protein
LIQVHIDDNIEIHCERETQLTDKTEIEKYSSKSVHYLFSQIDEGIILTCRQANRTEDGAMISSGHSDL